MKPWIVQNLWLIPALPMLAAGLSALAPQRCRKYSASLAIGSMFMAFLLSLWAFAQTIGHPGEAARQVSNFQWFQFAAGDAGILKLGWVLDPLAAVMLVMVSLVGLLIFIYSLGYMAHDDNFTRFFTFLSLFAGAMLGVVIANSLLLLFICWELVGLTSYLLIGFWYHKPSAAAAAKKAFITTRIGDVALLLGMVWLYAKTGTLLFYDDGKGCLEIPTLARAFPINDFGPMALFGIALLIFVGAMGKSGQFPLHVWLPDAMEGPTPVSALIHAATMVAAGVFLVARVFALMKPDWSGMADPHTIVTIVGAPDATVVITWVGAFTAVFAASIAVAQNDIKRILAYSTVSQLGYMMMGLGVGGVAVGMFHLITHAFFKALLFMGAGSVIHGCHEEQDIRRMGGLRKYMPVTFATYAVGMLALAGFPLLFSGFWSKDEILHAAHGWPVSQGPFYLGLFGALLTAFYMTRQVALVFFGQSRAGVHPAHSGEGSATQELHANDHSHSKDGQAGRLPCVAPHESPGVMTWPLIFLAVGAVGLSAIGTPAWPWFQSFLGQHHGETGFAGDVISLMTVSSVIVFAGLGLGWWLYGRKPMQKADEPDVLEKLPAGVYTWLQRKYGVDELYEKTVIAFNAWWARVCAVLDEWVWGGAVMLVSYAVLGLSVVNRLIDELVINLGFDQGCDGVSRGGRLMSRLQDGRVQNYLRLISVALTVLVLMLIWGGKGR
jgi:NADH-quinone oxidoreductase subunit L